MHANFSINLSSTRLELHSTLLALCSSPVRLHRHVRSSRCAKAASAVSSPKPQQAEPQQQAQSPQPRVDYKPSMDGRVLFVGGIPWDAPADEASDHIKRLCPRATHVALRDPHRGWALVAFRSKVQAEEAAEALMRAAGGIPALGAALTVSNRWEYV